MSVQRAETNAGKILSDDARAAFARRCVALPTTRQLDVLAALLERRGAKILRCPLVSILDTPNQEHVQGWLRRFIEDESIRDLILLTGEGLRRLLDASERAGLHPAFLQRLARVRKIARGPKPGRALREIGLSTDVVTEVPTTQGVIAVLNGLSFETGRVAVQLYGSDPNLPLQAYLRGRDLVLMTVAPYVYADAVDEQCVLALIDSLARKEVDAIAFTSQPQVRRLLAVARKHGREPALRTGLGGCTVAAVGPVVADCLNEVGVSVDAVPDGRFFMRPLIDALLEKLNERIDSGPDLGCESESAVKLK